MLVDFFIINICIVAYTKDDFLSCSWEGITLCIKITKDITTTRGYCIFIEFMISFCKQDMTRVLSMITDWPAQAF